MFTIVTLSHRSIKATVTIRQSSHLKMEEGRLPINVDVGYGYNGIVFGEKTVDTKKPLTNGFFNRSVVYTISAHKLAITGNGTGSLDNLTKGMANDHKCPCNADDIRQIKFTGYGSFDVRYMNGFKGRSYLESIKFFNTGFEDTTINS